MIIGICGAGTMGRGIAIASLLAGHTVVLTDLSADALGVAQKDVTTQLRKAVEKGRLNDDACAAALGRCSVSTDLAALAPCDLVVEAIAERLDVKHTLFTNLETICTAEAILATNTSSISITALARVLQHPERFVGLHFFNPAHVMKLVEVIPGASTSEAVTEAALSFARDLGKTAVLAADVPGFIVNRVARNFYNEPQRIVMEGAATIAQVDTLMKGIGFKMGPFELMDLIGVDVNLDVTTSQWQQFYLEPRFTPSLMQRQAVDAGHHGRKTKRGFHRYD